MRRMRYLTWGIFVALVLTNFLFAQKKTAVDSSKQRRKNVRLQLPDEIIYGQNKSSRVVPKNKMTFPPAPTLLSPDYGTLFPALMISENKTVFSRKSVSENARKSLLAHWGRFQDTKFSGLWAQQGAVLNFQLAGHFQRIKGQFENSDYQSSGGSGFLGGNVTDNLSAIFAVDGGSQKYGLFRARQSNTTERDVQHFLTEIVLDFSNDKGHLLKGRFFYREDNFTDTDSSKLSMSDNWFGFNLGYNKKISSVFVHAYADYRHNSVGQDLRQSIFEAKFSAGIIPFDFLRVNGRVSYQDVEVSNAESETKIFPELEVVITPLQKLGGKITLKQEIVPFDFSKWVQLNPYVDFSANLRPMEKELELQTYVEWLATDNLEVRGALEFEKTKNDIFWTKNAQTDLFSWQRLQSTTMTKFSISGMWRLSPKLKLAGKLVTKFYSINDDSLQHRDANFPYAEKFNLPLSLQYQFTPNWNFDLGMNWVSSRHVSLLEDEKLPSFVLLSAKLERNIFSHYSLFFEGSNLLDQSVEIWENFPERGVSLRAGVRAEW